MSKELVNQELEEAAQRMLLHLTGSEETLKSLYLQPDRTVFLAEHAGIIFKVYQEGKTLQQEYENAQNVRSIGVPVPTILRFEAGPPAVLAMKYVHGAPLSSRHPVAAKAAGMYLQRIHTLSAYPPFSGGQQQWDAFISWWSNEEIEKIKRLGVFDPLRISTFQKYFEACQPLLVQRPIVLLHGDLQPAHLLLDPQTEQVVAFLDLADMQPGDPLLDIAVAALWDHDLADLLVEGYSGIEQNAETRQILSFYRLLRQFAEIPWLLERGFKKMAERNIVALQDGVEIFEQ